MIVDLLNKEKYKDKHSEIDNISQFNFTAMIDRLSSLLRPSAKSNTCLSASSVFTFPAWKKDPISALDNF